LAGTAIGVGCISGGMAGADALAGAWWPEGPRQPWHLEALFNLVIFVPMLALALLGGWATGVRVLRAGRDPLAMLAIGAAVGTCGVAVTTGYASFAGIARGGAMAPMGSLILIGSLMMLFQSATEEMLLRGWMLPAMLARWPAWAAVALTAIIFAGLHMLGGARGPIELVNLTLGGVMFGLLRWKSGGMIAPIAAHFAWNWSEALLLGLDPNPGVGTFGALIDLDLVGPAIWGGSDEGLNGSIAMLLVLAAVIVPLALWRPARDRS
jgi:membrane protease YdiL (CAAX protease family)